MAEVFMTPREILDARIEQLKDHKTAFQVYRETPGYQEENDVLLLPPQSSNVTHVLARVQKKQKQNPHMRVVDFMPRPIKRTKRKGARDRWGHGLKNLNYVNAYEVIEWDLLQWLCSFRSAATHGRSERLHRLLAITHSGPGPVDVPEAAALFGFRYLTLVNDLPVLSGVGATITGFGKRHSRVVLTDSEYEALWPAGTRVPLQEIPPQEIPPQERVGPVLAACLKHKLSLQATIDILAAAKCDDLFFT
jgi:hypothetical protein